MSSLRQRIHSEGKLQQALNPACSSSKLSKLITYCLSNHKFQFKTSSFKLKLIYIAVWLILCDKNSIDRLRIEIYNENLLKILSA